MTYLMFFVSEPDERRSPFLQKMASGAKFVLLEAADLQSKIPLFIPHLPGDATSCCFTVPHWCPLNMLYLLGELFPSR